jgi:hypothetical protein
MRAVWHGQMDKLHLLLVSSLIVNTAMAVGCASGFVDRASTSPADQAVIYRQEAVDLRAAARYYEGEAQRSAQEAGQDSERARRYRDFAQQASVQAIKADRNAEAAVAPTTPTQAVAKVPHLTDSQ